MFREAVILQSTRDVWPLVFRCQQHPHSFHAGSAITNSIGIVALGQGGLCLPDRPKANVSVAAWNPSHPLQVEHHLTRRHPDKSPCTKSWVRTQQVRIPARLDISGTQDPETYAIHMFLANGSDHPHVNIV